jgi:phosphomevalonate kinase
MKAMGQFIGVPIEPDEQSELLDACCAIPGIIGGGVPGGKSGMAIDSRMFQR